MWTDEPHASRSGNMSVGMLWVGHLGPTQSQCQKGTFTVASGAGTPLLTWTGTQAMHGPARVDIKWKDIAARPFKVVVLVELAAQACKEGCTQSDAARVHCCRLAGNFVDLPVHG